MSKNQHKLFLQKIYSLSDELQYVFDAGLISDLADNLALPNGFNIDNLNDLIREVIIDDFNFSLIDKKINSNLNIDNSQKKEFILDIIGIMFLPLDQYLEEVNVRKELTKRGGKVEDYQEQVDFIEEKLMDERVRLFEKVAEKVEELDLDEEASDAISLISDDLLSILNNTDIESIIELNGGLINLLQNKNDFSGLVVRTLGENQQKLSNADITVNKKQVKPTIANWLKDFIAQVGTDYFDEVKLSEYLTNSPNAKKLNQKEKKLLGKLLILYRNLKFFPQGLVNKPIEQWEIIPIDREKIVSKKQKVNEKTINADLPDLSQMTAIEKKAYLEENNLTKKDLE